MPFRTLGEAVKQVAAHMSLVNGNGMTPYSPELIVSYLHRAHTHIVDDGDWSEMELWYTRTLDGSTGKITQTIPGITDWKNIKRIYHESFMTPLPVLSTYVNPLASTLMLGYRGLPPEEDIQTGTNRYLVMFYPITLVGQVLFNIEREIDWTNMETVLPIDWWAHVDYASWAYAMDDGTNPAQASKFETSFNLRMNQVRARENARPVLLQPNQVIPNEWFEIDAPYA